MYMWLLYKQYNHHALALVPCLVSSTLAYIYYTEFKISYFLITFFFRVQYKVSGRYWQWKGYWNISRLGVWTSQLVKAFTTASLVSCSHSWQAWRLMTTQVWQSATDGECILWSHWHIHKTFYEIFHPLFMQSLSNHVIYCDTQTSMTMDSHIIHVLHSPANFITPEVRGN